MGSQTELIVPATRRGSSSRQAPSPSPVGDCSIQAAQPVHTTIGFPTGKFDTEMGSDEGKHETFYSI